MNSEDRHKIRNLLQVLIQLPAYITDESDEDFDLDLLVELATKNVKQIDEYIGYLDKAPVNE
jgi:hypothetical protein